MLAWLLLLLAKRYFAALWSFCRNPNRLRFAATFSRPWLPLQEEWLPKALLRVFPSRRHMWASLQVHKLVRLNLIASCVNSPVTIRLQPEHERVYIL